MSYLYVTHDLNPRPQIITFMDNANQPSGLQLEALQIQPMYKCNCV